MGAEKQQTPESKGMMNVLVGWARKNIFGVSNATKDSARSLLNEKNAPATPREFRLDGPTMLQNSNEQEMLRMNNVLDMESIMKRLESIFSITLNFTLKSIPFTVAYALRSGHPHVAKIEVRSPSNPHIAIDCSYDSDIKEMTIDVANMPDSLQKKGLYSAIIRSLLRSTNSVNIPSVTNDATKKIDDSAQAPEQPDCVLKCYSELAGPLGREFLCQLGPYALTMSAIRVDEKLQELLALGKMWMEGNNNFTGENLHDLVLFYDEYEKTAGYSALDARWKTAFQNQKTYIKRAAERMI